MNRLITTFAATALSFWCAATVHAADDLIASDDKSQEQSSEDAFENASTAKWRQVFFDPGTGNWKEQWFLDGEVGQVANGPDGMKLTAGPEFRNDAHHMVLWTRDQFSGDLKIEFEYTRLDDETRCVNILYIQAKGSGEGPYAQDISEWNTLRRVPSMKMYYNHMHTYHISYAAFPNNDDSTGYIRARRYRPNASGLKGTDLKPDYYPEGLFETGVPHKITVIKKARALLMRIQNARQTYYCRMANPELPAIDEGRVGLRHMFTRSSLYKNFRISAVKTEKHVEYESLVKKTHLASLEARDRVLRKTIARDSSWPDGAWGDTLWSLAALYLNQDVESANARLLNRASDYIALHRAKQKISDFTPEQASETPWAYFAITDYVRILCLFRANSVHFPGRLTTETEAAMKEALWYWVKSESKVSDASLDNLLVLLGTENHDLTRRPNHYLISSILKDDPAFRERLFDDGHTAAEHAEAYTTFFRERPRTRAATGLWFEVGSNTYQKYSWPALFNLHELAPDPIIRERFGLLLDLAFIEEAQISVRGRRGGGRSRAEYGRNAFESYKNLLYVPDNQPAGSSHSRVIETSRYQLPAAAILLRNREFPADEPFVIRNRVLGELESRRRKDGKNNRFAADSALVNYVWRTPHYLLGSTLQNPALMLPNPEKEKPALKYGGISRQKRWCGMLFDDPESREVCAVCPVIEQTRGGRPQHSHWSVQHRNVILLQRIAPETKKRMGSYSTGAISIRFHGNQLQKIEEGGWIFTSNRKAYLGVKFLDGAYEWDEEGEQASPAEFDHATDASRILFHAGDVTTHSTFEQFRSAVLASRLAVSPEKVKYQFGPTAIRIVATVLDVDHTADFTLPTVDGQPIDLRPATTWQSPYLNGDFGGDKVSITVGPVTQTFDFSRDTISDQ